MVAVPEPIIPSRGAWNDVFPFLAAFARPATAGQGGEADSPVVKWLARHGVAGMADGGRRGLDSRCGVRRSCGTAQAGSHPGTARRAVEQGKSPYRAAVNRICGRGVRGDDGCATACAQLEAFITARRMLPVHGQPPAGSASIRNPAVALEFTDFWRYPGLSGRREAGRAIQEASRGAAEIHNPRKGAATWFRRPGPACEISE
jgi:hypothetical protein